MNKSVSICEVASALSKAQAEIPAVKFDSQNPFLKNKYASLGAVIETARPVLAKHGLAIVQSPVSSGEQIGITTLVTHTSGEWLEDTIYINSTDSKGLSVAQSAGVVISYLRRYSLQAFLNMYADEDTDGHKVEAPAAKAEPTESESKAKAVKAFAELKYRADKVGVTVEPLDASWTREKMLAHYKEQQAFVKAAEAQAQEGK
jgi:hypothetical protein